MPIKVILNVATAGSEAKIESDGKEVLGGTAEGAVKKTLKYRCDGILVSTHTSKGENANWKKVVPAVLGQIDRDETCRAGRLD